MKKILLLFLFSLFFISCMNNNSQQISLENKNKHSDSIEVLNLRAENNYAGYIDLSWDIKDKTNIKKVQVMRNYLTGGKWEILATLDPNEEYYCASQRIISYAMYKIRLIYKSGKKSRGSLVKVLPKSDKYRRFYFYTNSEDYTPYEVYEIQMFKGIPYIQIEDIYDIISYYYGEVNYRKNKTYIKINSLNNSLKVSFNLKNGTAKFYDGSGKKIMNVIDQITAESQDYRLKAGTSSRLDIYLEKYEDKIQEAFKVSTKEKIIDLKSYNLKIVLSNNKYYFPLHLVGELLFDNYIQILEYDEDFAFAMYPYTENEYKREKMTKEFKAYTFDYFINLCKNKYTVTKDKNINFDKLRNENYATIVNSKTNDEFYAKFRDFIKNIGDWHTSLESFGQAIFQVKSTNYNENLEKKYDDIEALALSIPDKKFENFEIKDLNNSLGYFYMKDFTKDSKKHIDKMIRKFQNKKAIIIDERWNPGGNLPILLYLLEYIAKDEFTVNFYKNDKFYTKIIKNNRKLRYNGNIILLTNRSSYSASTFFAAIAKENHLLTILGEKTNGGASPTVSFVLPDNSTVNISAEVLITDHEGNSYDNGVEPDIFIEENYNNGQDAVLEKAIEFANNI